MVDTVKDGEDWRAELNKHADLKPDSDDHSRAMEPGRGRHANSPAEIPARGWKDILYRAFWSIPENRLVALSGGVAFFSLMAVFPAIATVVSLYGLTADSRTIVDHLNLFSGILPAGVLDLIKQQILLVASKSNNTLGLAFLAGLFVALWSANSGTGALFDALNVVYGEKEKRTLVRLYATTFTITIGSILFVVVAIAGVVILPAILLIFGQESAAGGFLEILRWPLLLLTVMIGLSVVYRYGPSRHDAKWRWLTVGGALSALLWVGMSMLFSWYVSAFDSYNRLYGSLGAAVGFMTWTWVSVFVILLGATVNAEMEHQTAHDTTLGRPKPMGRRGANMADHVGKSIDEAEASSGPIA
jgi:membrane protein